MRPSSILLLLLTFLFCSLRAQDTAKVEFFVGPDLEEQKGNRIWETFGHSEEFFYCIRTDRRKKGEFIIEKIGTDSLTVVKTLSFTPSEISNRVPSLAYPISTANSSFLIATAEDPEGTDIYIMAYRISDDLQISKEPIVIGIADREALISEHGFLMFQSEDSQKVILFIPEEKNPVRNEKFALRYFDSELNLLDTKEIEIPYPSDKVLLEDAVMTPNGVFHGIISLRKESEVRVLPDSYSLLTYNPAKEGVKEKSLALGNKWFYDLKLTLTPDTNLWLAGYYSNMVEPSMVGTFSVVIDSNTGQLLNTGLSPFDRDFRLMFRHDIKNNEDDLGLFKLDKVFLKSNGSLTMVSEKRYSRESTVYDPASRMYTVILIHYNEELLISTIRPSSRIEENIVIPKYQSSSQGSGRYTSYVTTQWGNKLLFFYNDHVRNESLSPVEYNDYRALNNDNNINITYCILGENSLEKMSINSDAIDGYHLDAEQQYKTTKCQILTTYNGNRTRYIKVLTP
ncbi:hypothetical protein O3Q51_03585 [Cryomorphaceae bacterium 1068]|nr:hypothetical protein [Cryomorphaceae bacterium 1068]